MNSRVEFISYSGKYPNLCRGKLILSIDGNIVIFDGMCSGGSVWFDDDWNEHVETGPWSIDIPEKWIEYYDEIIECINSNIQHGCCGGCV